MTTEEQQEPRYTVILVGGDTHAGAFFGITDEEKGWLGEADIPFIAAALNAAESWADYNHMPPTRAAWEDLRQARYDEVERRLAAERERDETNAAANAEYRGLTDACAILRDERDVLKAEVGSLREQVAKLWKLPHERDGLAVKNAALQAEVERLRVALGRVAGHTDPRSNQGGNK